MEEFVVDNSEDFDYIDHSIEPDNSIDGESVLELPSQIIVCEEEIQVHRQVITRKTRSTWYLPLFQPIEDLTVGDTSALNADSKAWQLHAR